MKQLIYLFSLVIVSLITAIFCGNPTITSDNIVFERPIYFMGVFLFMLGVTFMIASAE